MFVERVCVAELQAPDRTVRLFALEEAIQEGNSPGFLAQLQRLHAEETDEECRLMFDYAIQAVTARLAPAARRPVETDPATFVAVFLEGTELDRWKMLNSLGGKALPALAPIAPELLMRESVPRLQAGIIRCFASHWPSGQRGVLFGFLDSPHQILSHAALKALSHIAPRELLSNLPDLLASGDVRIRAHALRTLAGIDPEEALRHFEALLLGEKPQQRLSALAVGFALPFERVKISLFKLFLIERDPRILQIVGDYFRMNPDPQVPFRLLELQDQVPAENVGFLRSLEADIRTTLHAMGGLPLEYDECLGRFQETLRRRRRERENRQSLPSPLEEPSPTETGPGSTARPERVSAHAWGGLPAKEKVRIVSRLTEKDKPSAAGLLQSVLGEADPPADLAFATLRAATRLRLPGFEKAAERFLTHPGEDLAAQALAYLGDLYPDRVSSRVHAFLKSGKARVQAVAFRLLAAQDPVQAMRAIELTLDRPREARHALEWMVSLDFPLIRDLLVTFLGKKPPPEEFSLGLALFETNPDAENEYALLLLERTLEGEYSQLIAPVKQANRQLLKDLGILTGEQVLELAIQANERVEQELRRRTAAPPAYALEVIRRKTGKATNEVPVTGWWFRMVWVGVLLLVTVGGFYASRHPPGVTATPSEPLRVNGPGALPRPAPAFPETPAIAEPNRLFFDIPAPVMEQLTVDGTRRAEFMSEIRAVTGGPR